MAFASGTSASGGVGQLMNQSAIATRHHIPTAKSMLQRREDQACLMTGVRLRVRVVAVTVSPSSETKPL